MTDNISEIQQPQGKDIPINWKLPDNFGENNSVIQIDQDNGFISYAPTTPSEKMKYASTQKMSGEKTPLPGHEARIDTFFDMSGEEKAKMTYGELEGNFSNARLAFNGELQTQYRISDVMRIDFFDPLLMKSLGSVAYDDEGKLSRFILHGNFLAEGKDDIDLHCPQLNLNYDEGKSGLKAEVSENSKEEWRKESGENENEVYCYSRKGERVRISWETQGDRYLIQYAHLDSGKVNTVTALKAINLQEIRNIIDKKPPYTKTKRFGKEALDVPWLKMPEIAGANLSPSTLPKA